MKKLLAAVLCICFILPVRGQEVPRKTVALTFDDGPSGRFTRALLEGLEERGVKATFFLCGYRMKQYPDLTERIFREGHEIGFHGYTHGTMETMSRRDIARELLDSQALLPAQCRPVFLRPPGGKVSDGVRQVAQARGLAIAGWSVDPRDWATSDTLAVERDVLDRVEDGDVILLHDMTSSSVRAALDIVDVLQKRGFDLVTLSRLAKLRGVETKPGKIYQKFPPS